MSTVAVPNRNQVVVFNSIVLHVKKVTLNANLHVRILSAMKDKPATYAVRYVYVPFQVSLQQKNSIQHNFRRTVVTSFQELMGTTTIDKELISSGVLPRRIFLLVISTARTLGVNDF